MTVLPTPGASGPYHPASFATPPSERQLEHARAAAAALERRPRRLNQLGLRRARKGGRY